VGESPITGMETKVQECSKAQEQPKMVSTPAETPRKGKRMTNVLKVVLRPTKMVPPAAPKIYVITSGSDRADPSGSVSTRLKSDSLSKKEALPIPEAMSF
jgi:hypothetical protein